MASLKIICENKNTLITPKFFCSEEEKVCKKCGGNIDGPFDRCPSCGVRLCPEWSLITRSKKYTQEHLKIQSE